MTFSARTLLLVATLLCAACGDAPEGAMTHDGGRLYVMANCTTCHGKDGAGGQLGPPLRGLEQHWTRESLADYLADPKAAIAKDARLRTISLNYTMHMPPVTFSAEQRLLIAAHALALSAAAR